MEKVKTTKDQLLILFKKNNGITIDEIMEHFTISETAIRKHLHELEKQKLIVKTAHKQDIGRPFFTYTLTKKGHGTFPNQYESLPVELLEDLEELQGTKAVRELLYKRMERQEKEFLEELDTTGFEDKVNALVEFQNSTGYMVEVVKSPEGHYTLTNYNCPIANIAHKYRQVCSNEKKLYNRIFEESDVIPHAFITTGAHVCQWTIKAPQKNE